VSVSVVIPNRNYGATLERAIVSAFCQAPLEVVVVDDASTDNSCDIARHWEQLSRGVVRLVANRQKADNWQEAMAAVFHELAGDTVVCCASDDTLLPNMIHAADSFSGSPVVFAEYHVCYPELGHMHSVSHGIGSTVTLTAEQVRGRIRGNGNATETGIGSAMRRDLLLWTASLRFWRCGPFGDSISYAAVAALHGATYVAGAGAAITSRPTTYGRATASDDEQLRHYTEESRLFLKDAGVDEETARRLMEKRCIKP
jgi:glycosyltransferase involved in cell wall biosynthesis